MEAGADPSEYATLILLEWWREAEEAVTKRLQAEQDESWTESA